MRLRICLNTPFEADFASIVSLRVPITLDLLSIVHPVFRSRDGATVALFGLQTMFGEGNRRVQLYVVGTGHTPGSCPTKKAVCRGNILTSCNLVMDIAAARDFHLEAR
jgi:hypothetical protein